MDLSAPAIDRIRAARHRVPSDRAVLVALSGIDGAGKGYVTTRIAAALERQGLRPAVINIDGWLNLPHLRFSPWRPAAHFYAHAVRFEEMFARLVLPLRDRRSVRLVADHVEETATTSRPHLYAFDDIDVILLEGIYLLKRALRDQYDLSIWVECGFETALRRAMARGQEGLSPEATARAYRTIYFPAQRIHIERDDPGGAADLILPNDPVAARRRSTNGPHASWAESRGPWPHQKGCGPGSGCPPARRPPSRRGMRGKGAVQWRVAGTSSNS